MLIFDLRRASACALLLAIVNVNTASALEPSSFDEEVTVVATTPGGGTGIDADKLAFNVQSADADALARSQALDLSDYLSSNLASVSINSAQNNPLQPDVQYRGYTASPLLGLPMGVSVYQNGVRINEPLGDSVNWDLLPQSAVHNITLIGGANPLFGLNTLGGALSITLKNGFNFAGHAVEFSGGSWNRKSVNAESGGNNGVFGYYVNVDHFEEDGWRDLSPSRATNVYAALGWRGAKTDLDVYIQHGDSDLQGNGAAPIGLLAIDRDAIFTAPDITENNMEMYSAHGVHEFNETIEFAANAFYRENETDSVNGDASEFQLCELAGTEFLLEGFEDDDLDELGIDDDDVCEDNALGAGMPGALRAGVAVNDPESLEEALNALAGEEEFNIEDVSESLTGSGLLSDEAIINKSVREQETYGGDFQFTFTNDAFGRSNYLVSGFAYFKGKADFDSTTELARLNPNTRSAAGLGLGSFVGEAATNVATETETWSLYFLDAFDIREDLTLTFGGRFNSTDIRLRDRSGIRPELNGDHEFNRFNPSVGLSYSPRDDLNVFAGYSESSRAPTPIELACNEGVFQVARDAAEARGDDPDDIEFECRLPNAFLADPPLDEVVAKSIEVGVRGEFASIEHRAGYFRTVNNDDIIFQTTGRATGLFANVDETRRQGFEYSARTQWSGLAMSLSYSYVEATFESDFLALSPSHDFANDDGEIQVRAGDRIPGIPEHQFKLGADYLTAIGVGVGFDLIVNSDQVLRGDESNQLETVDGYSVVNLRANYQFNERLNLFVRVTNLFDNEYENFGLLGEDPSEVIPGLNDTRARFLGAGAERGVWAGFRISL